MRWLIKHNKKIKFTQKTHLLVPIPLKTNSTSGHYCLACPCPSHQHAFNSRNTLVTFSSPGCTEHTIVPNTLCLCHLEPLYLLSPLSGNPSPTCLAQLNHTYSPAGLPPVSKSLNPRLDVWPTLSFCRSLCCPPTTLCCHLWLYGSFPWWTMKRTKQSPSPWSLLDQPHLEYFHIK